MQWPRSVMAFPPNVQTSRPLARARRDLSRWRSRYRTSSEPRLSAPDGPAIPVPVVTNHVALYARRDVIPSLSSNLHPDRQPKRRPLTHWGSGQVIQGGFTSGRRGTRRPRRRSRVVGRMNTSPTDMRNQQNIASVMHTARGDFQDVESGWTGSAAARIRQLGNEEIPEDRDPLRGAHLLRIHEIGVDLRRLEFRQHGQ